MWALSLFTIPSLAFYLASDYIAESHYVAAALVDLLIIYSLSRIAKPTNLVIGLALASMASMFINLIGWIMYLMYLEPVYYEMAGVAFYSIVILMSMKEGINGIINNTSKDSCFHSIHTFRNKSDNRNA